MAQYDGTNIFEERAEHLSRSDLLRWTALAGRETRAVSKLKGMGAKLLIGPRGSGKSTLMRVAFYQLLDDGDALPVYVNYAQHLALEPMFHSRPDATQLFRQWVLSKVVLGCAQTLTELNESIPDIDGLAESAQKLITDLEMSSSTLTPDFMSPTRLVAYLTDAAAQLGRKRVVLLFDDAAHAFSAQQQREFFEIFRQLRTRAVAPKAAVYPGVTNYSSNMHVGHDAELVEAWYRADDPAFFDTMQEVLNRRLPSELLQEFEDDRKELLRYLSLASFGLPRSFLAMIQEVLDYDDETGEHSAPTKRRADAAIERNVQNVRQVFSSTGQKIPRYSNLISEGERLESRILAVLRTSNEKRAIGSKVVTVGFKQTITRQFQQVVDLMEYAGILRRMETQSRGSAGVFERYEVHAGFIISTNALALGRNPSTRDIVTSLIERPAAGLVRGKAETFLGDDYLTRCILNLTPCANCGTPRASDDAQFCMRCGRPLTEKSVYHEILQRPIQDLPIPIKKKSALARTKLKSIEDVLLDVEFKELRRGRSIGPVWAKRIHSAAEEYVSV